VPGQQSSACGAELGDLRSLEGGLERRSVADSHGRVLPRGARLVSASEQRAHMTLTKRLREGIRRGRIRCSVRVWTRPHVKVGNRYQMDDGHIVVDSIAPIALTDIT